LREPPGISSLTIVSRQFIFTIYDCKDFVMVQQEVDAKKSEGTNKPEQSVKRKGTRKNLPSVAYLLAHGDPETAHLPKTWWQILGFPVALAVVFFISFLTFHYAPHSKSRHPGFKLPRKNVPPMDHVKVPVPLDPMSKAMDAEKLEPTSENEL
jgi:hypothetical protein